MGVHYPSEPDFNAEADDEPSHPHARQIIIYTGAIASLLALLVILYLNM
ncbi:hypothetical protein [Gordonia sp. NPDC003376]